MNKFAAQEGVEPSFLSRDSANPQPKGLTEPLFYIKAT